MRDVLTLVLGGGQGSRLYPLTKFRSKPAVPLAGKYRIIDIPLSNCIHSGLNRIYVLTQFNSVSLHQHIRRTYTFDVFSGGFVEILAAQQTLDSAHWYQGTADAVRQNLRYWQQPDVALVLILSGDQLYRMNFADMVRTHRESRADVTIAALPVRREQAGSLGIMRVDESGRVHGFLEKPQTDAELSDVEMAPQWFERNGVASHDRKYLASMGIYLFNRKTLEEVLTKTDYHDFGREIFPASVRARHVQVHLFDGYWEDIGTIASFYQANLELTRPVPPFALADATAPLYTHARFLPPSRIDGATIRDSLVADGCMIEEGARVENSVVGVRSRIGRNVTIRNSVLMGADFYQSNAEIAADRAAGRVPLGIGEGSHVEGAIVDKNCRLGQGVRVINRQGLDRSDETALGLISDGVVVLAKDAEMADGMEF